MIIRRLGPRALSEFRSRKLLERMPGIEALNARYIHLIETMRQLDIAEQTLLDSLLEYGAPGTEAAGQTFIVMPRVGTISPWSSKATDIAKSAGLDVVTRIERSVVYTLTADTTLTPPDVAPLYDRMTEMIVSSLEATDQLFVHATPRPLGVIDSVAQGRSAFEAIDRELGLALDNQEIDYLLAAYQELGRNPTDVELMMFGAVNSEHCRHKIFGADWVIDGKPHSKSLFKMIKNTYEHHSDGVLSAYSDNAAVLAGQTGVRFFADADGEYHGHDEPIHSVIKVETHNHPTAIAPFPGAATGTGGEIRDEGATGRGAKPKMGLAGYSVSDLNIPNAKRPWERAIGKPAHFASSLDIMIEAPIGAASFGNEFGRPNLAGYFRTYQQEIMNDEVKTTPSASRHSFLGDSSQESSASVRLESSSSEDSTALGAGGAVSTSKTYGYHKPIMIAGGLGNIRDEHVTKGELKPGMKIIVLGGPAMLIGLGGGAASSMSMNDKNVELDFASVQRANPEMERRAQEVIDACWKLGDHNPIVTIHDIGAGGYSVALSEFTHDSGLGGRYELRDIPNADMSMSPMEIWCNEAQERYVIGIEPGDLERFTALCERERCPFAVVGEATAEPYLVLHDARDDSLPIDIPMSLLFGNPPKMTRRIKRQTIVRPALKLDEIDLSDAIERVLTLPAVGSKKFLITIGDRTVGGLTMRDQMVGRWQVPVADVAVTAASFDDTFGEAMSMGERAPVALIDAPASARIAIAETVTNLLAADIAKLSDIKLSANWMAAAGEPQENQNLYDTVLAVGEEFCPALNLTIPVGKDSLSMKTTWRDGNESRTVMSPLSLIVTGFAPVVNAEKTLTPELRSDDDTVIMLVQPHDHQRLGGSALAQVYEQLGERSPDISANQLQQFFDAVTELKQHGKILAYHDRSDGGMVAALAEMSFAARRGLDIVVQNDALAELFNEEVGALIQVRRSDIDAVRSALPDSRIAAMLRDDEAVRVVQGEDVLYESSRAALELLWSDTSYQIQALRDNPELADQERSLVTSDDHGLAPKAGFALARPAYSTRPTIAIFREQGVNGQVEMAAAFTAAGFTAIDVHLSDLKTGRYSLDEFTGLAACGGFSYGDVLGAGEGWAKTILVDKVLRQQFSAFFARPDTFSLGVCNGCQMLSSLKELIPGAEAWPRFVRNASEQFEARLVQTKVVDSPSILFKGMAGSVLPVPVAHGEGRVEFTSPEDAAKARATLAYVDSTHRSTELYPLNPNGSRGGLTGFTTPDGRATIMMPHPERAFQSRQLSWRPSDWNGDSPWLQMFVNAREWVERRLDT